MNKQASEKVVCTGQPSHDLLPVVQAPTGITFLGGENPAGVSTAQRIEAFKTGPKAG